MSDLYLALDPGIDTPAPSGAPLAYDYDQVIGNSVAQWWLPYAGFVSPASGNIQDLLSMKLSGGTTLSQPTVAQRPLLMSDPLVCNGKPFLRFAKNPAGLPDRFAFTFPAASNLSWTKVMIVRQFNGGAPESVNFWNTTNVVGRHFLTCSATTGIIAHRVDSTNEAVCYYTPADPTPFWQLPHLLMASFDHLTGTVALSVDGGAFATATNALATATRTDTSFFASATDSTNQGTSGDVWMAALAPLALHLPANAALLGYIKQYTRDNFGLTIA